MICSGNVEQFTFYAFGELRNFFSAKFDHKCSNAFILAFFFLVIWTSIALPPLLKFSHGGKVRCILDDYALSLQGMVCYVLDNGIFFLLLGSAHQLLIEFPNIQLILLFNLDCVWTVVKCYFFFKKIPKSRLLYLSSIVENMIRLSFQVVSYLYQNKP